MYSYSKLLYNCTVVCIDTLQQNAQGDFGKEEEEELGLKLLYKVCREETMKNFKTKDRKQKRDRTPFRKAAEAPSKTLWASLGPWNLKKSIRSSNNTSTCNAIFVLPVFLSRTRTEHVDIHESSCGTNEQLRGQYEVRVKGEFPVQANEQSKEHATRP